MNLFFVAGEGLRWPASPSVWKLQERPARSFGWNAGQTGSLVRVDADDPMAGLLCAGVVRVFKEQGIMPQRGGQPLHPIHYGL